MVTHKLHATSPPELAMPNRTAAIIKPVIDSLLKKITKEVAKKKFNTTRSIKKFMRSNNPPQRGLLTSFTALGIKTRMRAI